MVKKIVLAIMVFGTYLMAPVGYYVSATTCPDVEIIFARGSGEERWMGQNYLTFKKELSEKLDLVDLKYGFLDLDYPAIGIGDAWTLFSTFISGGEAYDFGESVNLGVKNLFSEINSTCENTKFVIAGYSQGAMVVSKAINLINADKIIYAATFGDPKIYLPEGQGPMPAACKGKNLSNYRVYVPDCRVYEGLLGGYKPYQPENYIDKLGTWCNKMDIFCSTYFSIDSHVSYVSDGLYEDASKVIFDKILSSFNIENNYISLHDTAILIDSTGSMSGLIEKYKSEALSLAKKTLNAGGRVALFDYRDLNDPYEVKEHCNFETCTLESFGAELDKITADSGGDKPESLLSSSLKVMQKLNWKFGSTKSLVILTDASYHNPDIDGTTFADVVALSKRIDPVNFYIITPSGNMRNYDALATATDGAVVNSGSDLSILTNTIITRYDSLPRVEENSDAEALPVISNVLAKQTSANTMSISWQNTGIYTMVVLNDAVLGITNQNTITISELNLEDENILRLVPLTENLRGSGVEVKFSAASRGELAIPKAPNAGRR